MKATLVYVRGCIAIFLCQILFGKVSFAQYNYQWQTDGTVNTTVIAGNKLYIGGTFGYVGAYSGGLAVTDDVNGVWDAAWPLVNNDVFSILPDGTGGFFIGGGFTKVAGVPRD